MRVPAGLENCVPSTLLFQSLVLFGGEMFGFIKHGEVFECKHNFSLNEFTV